MPNDTSKLSGRRCQQGCSSSLHFELGPLLCLSSQSAGRAADGRCSRGRGARPSPVGYLGPRSVEAAPADCPASASNGTIQRTAQPAADLRERVVLELKTLQALLSRWQPSRKPILARRPLLPVGTLHDGRVFGWDASVILIALHLLNCLEIRLARHQQELNIRLLQLIPHFVCSEHMPGLQVR